MKTRSWNGIQSNFGYDPIEKQFKVLSTTSEEHQVMTLGRNMSWRKVECSIRHSPDYNAICINGVLYYQGGIMMIVCFDIRSEKFRFMKVKNVGGCETLINYNGKLGSLESGGWYCFSGRSKSFVLWILEDIVKQKWSKHVYVLPPMWRNVVGDIKLDFVGVIGGNEFVFWPHGKSSSFCLFCYNIERKTVRRVEIQGLETSNDTRVYAFVNYVEDVKLIDGY